MINIFINISWNCNDDFKPKAKEKREYSKHSKNVSLTLGKKGWTKKNKNLQGVKGG